MIVISTLCVHYTLTTVVFHPSSHGDKQRATVWAFPTLYSVEIILQNDGENDADTNSYQDVNHTAENVPSISK